MDTNHFLLKFGQIVRVPEGALLCTVDVVALYPSMPHEEGLEAVREVLDRRVHPSAATDALIELALLVLDKNCFKFDNKY